MVEYAAEELLALQVGTPLALINGVLLKGEFAPAPDEPVAENEKIIGELSLFEKAVYTARDSIADANNALVQNAMEKDEKLDINKVRSNKTNHEALNSIFWACIRNRLGDVVYEQVGVGLRRDYKIVSYSDAKGGDSFLRMLLDGLP